MKKILLLISLLFFAHKTTAQTGYQEHVVIDNSFGSQTPTAICNTDIDNDGFLDIVTIATDEIVWYKNLNGTGNFSKPIFISNASGGRIQVLDINNDGLLDIVFTGKWATSGYGIYWIKNTDGKGAFTDPVLIEAHDTISDGGLSDYQIIDMDNDNDLDILFKVPNNYGNTRLSYLKNDGLGNFTLSTLLTQFANFIALDANGDKLQDLLVRYDNQLKLFIQQSNNTFTTSTLLTNVSLSKKFLGEDVDNDGDLDIVFVNENGNAVDILWYENADGKGTFKAAKFLVNLPDFTGTTTDRNFYRIFLTDFDSDGKKDILFYYSKGLKVGWFKNKGAGVFAAEQVIKSSPLIFDNFAAGDMNNDGAQDLTAIFNHDVILFKNEDGKGTFAKEKQLSKYAYFVYNVENGDIDGDGDLDIVSSSGDSKIAWYKNTNGLGDFSGDQLIISDHAGVAQDLFVKDIDNDGDLDVIITSLVYSDNTTSMIWYENDGAGNFIKERKIFSDKALRNIIFTDVNKDGKIDVIAMDNYNALFIAVNLGNKTFAERTFVKVSVTYISSCFADDVNKDGNIDLIVANGQKIIWYENDGSGNFTIEHTGNANITADKAGYFFMNDLDNDNDQDIVYYESGRRKVGWYENLDGLGNYAPSKTIINTPKAIDTFSFLDVDKDGDLDIIYNMVTETATTWHENQGAGKIGPAKVYSANTTYFNNLRYADLNADGRIDYTTFSRDEDKIAWYENLGNFKNKIFGNVRLDIDNNGCDATDLAAPSVLVSTSNGTNTFSTFTKQNGSYDFIADVNKYTTSVMAQEYNYKAATSKYVTTFTAENQTEKVDFCLVPSQLFDDIEVKIYPYGEPRPGFAVKYKIHIKNKGTNVKSGSASLNFDNQKIEFIAASEKPEAQTPNTIQFAYKDLKAFESKIIDVNFKVLTIPTVNLGEKLVFNLLAPLSADAKPDDNQFELKETIVGSYDPNDIRVLEGEKILVEDADEYLHYIIRFQNKGNSYAQRVRVSNLLDDKLDWTTLNIESYSHENKVIIQDGKTIDFVFDAIYLPSHLSNEEGSNGYIAYKIKPKSNVSLGDIFKNDAAIYFDYNPDIKTNTVSTEIVDKTLGTGDFLIEKFVAYPNPTKGPFVIQTKDKTISKIMVYNTLGQMVLVTTNHNIIDLSSLRNGIYFVKIVDDQEKNTIIKVVKN